MTVNELVEELKKCDMLAPVELIIRNTPGDVTEVRERMLPDYQNGGTRKLVVLK